MVASLLLELDIQDGRELIERLDAGGVPPVVAFWAHESESERWRLILAYEEYDRVGSLEIYKMILPFTDPDSELALSGITATGLNDDLVKLVRTSFARRNVSLDRPRHTMVRGKDVVVYRA